MNQIFLSSFAVDITPARAGAGRRRRRCSTPSTQSELRRLRAPPLQDALVGERRLGRRKISSYRRRVPRRSRGAHPRHPGDRPLAVALGQSADPRVRQHHDAGHRVRSLRLSRSRSARAASSPTCSPARTPPRRRTRATRATWRRTTPVDCCLSGSDLVCPPRWSRSDRGGALRAPRRLRCSLLPAAGLHLGGERNPFPPPPTRHRRRRRGQPPPSGDVTVTIDTPAASPIPASAPAASSTSARTSTSGGSDFVDGTSVKVTVTAKGSSPIVENGQLVLSTVGRCRRLHRSGEPRRSAERHVHADRDRRQLGRHDRQGARSTSPSTRARRWSSPRPIAGKSYKRSLTIEVVATDAFGLRAAHRPPRSATSRSRSSTPASPTPSGARSTSTRQMPPLFGDQLLTVVADQRQRAAHRGAGHLPHRQRRSRSSRAPTPCPGEIVGGIVEISAVIQDNAGVLDSSVIAVIGDDTSTPLFELPLKPQGGGVYSALFDSAQLTSCTDPPATGLCIVFPTMSFRASDCSATRPSSATSSPSTTSPPVADLDSAEPARHRRSTESCAAPGRSIRWASTGSSATCPTTTRWSRRCSICARASRTTGTAPRGSRTSPSPASIADRDQRLHPRRRDPAADRRHRRQRHLRFDQPAARPDHPAARRQQPGAQGPPRPGAAGRPGRLHPRSQHSLDPDQPLRPRRGPPAARCAVHSGPADGGHQLRVRHPRHLVGGADRQAPGARAVSSIPAPTTSTRAGPASRSAPPTRRETSACRRRCACTSSTRGVSGFATAPPASAGAAARLHR